jgi:hypothetical protein
VIVEADIADVRGPIRYARARAGMPVRIGLVLAWALALLVVAELPLWMARAGIGGELATWSHHFVLADGRTFVPRGHAIEDFVTHAQLRRLYAVLGEPEPLRMLAVALLGLLSAGGLQLVFGRVDGRLMRRREQLAMFTWLIGAVLLLRAWLTWLPLAATWAPTGALLVPIALQLGTRATLACAAMLGLACAVMVPPFDPVLGVTVASAGMAIAMLAPSRRRGGWLWTAPFVFGGGVATIIGYVAAQLLVHGSLDPLDANFEWGRLDGAIVGGLAWPLAGLALEPIFERAVGNISRSTLLELSDLNNPILQRISTRAPGTWAHSRAMANLAESAAHAVGADALLIRVGAYYHDLGKADEPQYFVENLPRGRISPHDGLSPERSAEKIIHHVRASMVRARAAGLPEPIIDFMHSHHGNGRVEFFYQRARALAVERGDDPERVDVSAFTYPGACPDSPETGILMIVDSVEAASRTLTAPDRKQLDALLRQIVFSKLMAGQLDHCGLSARDLRRIVDTLIDSLLAAAHDRVAYPWQQEEKAAARADAGMVEPSGNTPIERPAAAGKPTPLRVLEPE